MESTTNETPAIKMWHLPDTVPQIQIHYSRPHLNGLKQITTSGSAYEVLKECFDPSKMDYTKSLVVLLLTRGNYLLGIAEASKGSSIQTAVTPAEISQLALLAHAKGIIIGHNNPAGTLKASEFDTRVHQRLKEALKLFEMALFDHIIVTSEGYYSFSDQGVL